MDNGNVKKLRPTDTSLAPEQAAEFPTPLLRAFAESYLRFRYSSPCTAKRPAYRYFEPLKENEMADADILYGPDREAAYDRLMADFSACRIAKEFDRYLSSPKTRIWWKSATVPGLILFKKWL